MRDPIGRNTAEQAWIFAATENVQTGEYLTGGQQYPSNFGSSITLLKQVELMLPEWEEEYCTRLTLLERELLTDNILRYVQSPRMFVEQLWNGARKILNGAVTLPPAGWRKWQEFLRIPMVHQIAVEEYAQFTPERLLKWCETRMKLQVSRFQGACPTENIEDYTNNQPGGDDHV